VAPLASALLGEGTPGLFWGTVPAGSINEACTQIINTGSYDLSATISGYDKQFSTTLSVSAIGGCLAGSDTPVGVQAV
jgi:hypothetical protein